MSASINRTSCSIVALSTEFAAHDVKDQIGLIRNSRRQFFARSQILRHKQEFAGFELAAVPAAARLASFNHVTDFGFRKQTPQILQGCGEQLRLFQPAFLSLTVHDVERRSVVENHIFQLQTGDTRITHGA